MVQGPLHIVEALRRAQNSPLDKLFPSQREMVNAAIQPGARIADHSGRGSGKTEGLAHGCQHILREEPDAPIAWIGLTTKSAKDNVWPVMRRVNADTGNYLTARDHESRWVTPEGGMFAVFGANQADEIEKLRGKKWRLVIIDESASFKRQHLKYLIEDVLEPRLVDLNGGLAVVGSPGVRCSGYYHDLCQGKDGFEVFCRNMLENPHFPNAEAWLQALIQRKGWDPEHPSLLREYYGIWARDTDSLVFKWSSERNAIPCMPADYSPDSAAWGHVVCLDLGYSDSTAWAIWAFRKDRSENKVYQVESFKWWGHMPEWCLSGLGIDRGQGLLPQDAAKITKRVMAKYRPWRVLGDEQGLGKAYLETFRRTFHIPILPAPKTDKAGQIELYNDGLRSGQIQIVEDANQDHIGEMELLQWRSKFIEVSDGGIIRHEERKETDSSFEDHLCDASRYGYQIARTYIDEGRNEKHPPTQSSEEEQLAKWKATMLRKQALKRKRKGDWWA